MSLVARLNAKLPLPYPAAATPVPLVSTSLPTLARDGPAALLNSDLKLPPPARALGVTVDTERRVREGVERGVVEEEELVELEVVRGGAKGFEDEDGGGGGALRDDAGVLGAAAPPPRLMLISAVRALSSSILESR